MRRTRELTNATKNGLKHALISMYTVVSDGTDLVYAYLHVLGPGGEFGVGESRYGWWATRGEWQYAESIS
jgi:hypothetical protein